MHAMSAHNPPIHIFDDPYSDSDSEQGDLCENLPELRTEDVLNVGEHYQKRRQKATELATVRRAKTETKRAKRNAKKDRKFQKQPGTATNEDEDDSDVPFDIAPIDSKVPSITRDPNSRLKLRDIEQDILSLTSVTGPQSARKLSESLQKKYSKRSLSKEEADELREYIHRKNRNFRSSYPYDRCSPSRIAKFGTLRAALWDTVEWKWRKRSGPLVGSEETIGPVVLKQEDSKKRRYNDEIDEFDYAMTFVSIQNPTRYPSHLTFHVQDLNHTHGVEFVRSESKLGQLQKINFADRDVVFKNKSVITEVEAHLSKLLFAAS